MRTRKPETSLPRSALCPGVTGPASIRPDLSSAAPTKTARPGRGTLATAILLSLSACGGDDAGIPIACAGDEICPPPSTGIQWAVQITPPTNSADRYSTDPHNQLTPQEFVGVTFDGTGTASLQFRPSAQVDGSVLDALGQPIARARVIAQLSAAIAGQNPYSFDTLTSDRPAGSFALRVPTPSRPAEQLYRLWVSFDDAAQLGQYPPHWLDSAVAGDKSLTVKLRPSGELAVVQGRLLNTLGEGVGGMTVQVLDASSRIVSSTTTSVTSSDATSGTYRVLVDPSLSEDTRSPLTVVVKPGPQKTNWPMLRAQLPLPRAGSDTRLDFVVPSFRKPVLFQVPIRGSGPNATNTPVIGAHVVAQVTLEDPATMNLGQRAVYVSTAESDAQGIAKLMLVPAPSGGTNLTYKISVTGPARTPFASVSQQELTVGPSEGLLAALTLPQRAQLRGRLLDAQGEPVASAQVVAQSIVQDTPTTSPPDMMALDAPPPQTTTDADGSFALRLDPGDYDLDFVPVSGTQPRTSLDNQRIQTSDLELGDVRLARITLGKVALTSPGGAPVQQVKVRVFQIADTSPRFGLACVTGLPCSRTAKLRAEAFTDSKGRAQFLLPDSTPLASPPRIALSR